MMPRGSRALLPAEIRTEPGPKPGTADALMGFPASPERSSRTVEAASRPLPSCTFDAASRGEATPGASGPCRTRE
jgi:hypothetical protein